MFKKMLPAFCLVTLGFLGSAHAASSGLPVFSANGFICGKEGITVTCKGTLPSGIGTVTGTGHDMVYLTVNIQQEGQPARYTYFSDTGCLIGYTFGAGGEPQEAVASHRSGAKKTFNLSGGQFQQLVEYCTPEQRGSAQATEPKKTETPPSMKPATPNEAVAAKKPPSTKFLPTP